MKTFHGIRCVHTEEWCQCTETDLITYDDGVQRHHTNVRAWRNLYVPDPNGRRDREAGGGTEHRDPSDPSTSSGA